MFASFAKESNGIDTFIGQSTQDDYDMLHTEQDEAYGKIVCDRNFSYMSQYNSSFLNRSVCQKRDFLIANKQKIIMSKKRQVSNSIDPTLSTQRESDVTSQPQQPEPPKMINLEKYGLQAQVNKFYQSRPKTQQQVQKKVRTPKENKEPSIIQRDYQYDNRTKFNLFNQERGRNSGLQKILNKMHLAQRNTRNVTTTLSRHQSQLLTLSVQDSYGTT